MQREFEGEWDEYWERLVVWMRGLPTRFRLTRVPVIGRYLFRNDFIGDPTTRNWIVPVYEELPQARSVHLPLDVLRPMIEKAAIRARAAKCICRASFDCHVFPHDLACLFLGNAFRNAGNLSRGFIEYLEVEEAIAHVERAARMGLVPTIIWDDDVEIFGAARNRGITICFCCDCCCDIRLGLKLGGEGFRKKVSRMEGVDVKVGPECNQCGVCADPGVCPSDAVRLGKVLAEIDLGLCVGCGRCIPVCPSHAISFSIDESVDVAGRLIEQVKEVTDIT